MLLRLIILLSFMCILGHLPGQNALRFPASTLPSQDNCSERVLEIINSKISLKNSVFYYPKGFENKENQHIQYGFEVEYTMDEAKVIFDNYMPDRTIFKDGQTKWLSLSFQDQLKFFDDNIHRIYPNGSRKTGKMIKISRGPLSKFLSDDLIYDSGNFELVYKPMDSMEELFNVIKNSKRLLGAGSMQVMISQAFNKGMYKDQVSLTRRIEEDLGYFNFVNELDTFDKLITGYHRYKSNPNILAAQSFNHPWLGPMTLRKNLKLQSILKIRYNNGLKLKQVLKDYDQMVTSSKFIGGLAFRPDIGLAQNRISAEIRDCHKSIQCIESRVKRETFFLIKGKSSFRKFHNMPSFDPAVTMTRKFSLVEAATLDIIFPAYNKLDDIEDMILSRNFSYPLRDWSRQLTLIGREDLKNVIELAQTNYKKKISKIVNEYNSKTITQHQAKRAVMGALVEFANESKLYDALKTYMNDEFTNQDIKLFDQYKISLNMNHIYDHDVLDLRIHHKDNLLHQIAC